MPITPGQTYRSADPRELIRIRIKTYVPGENRALVVDAATGKRPRPMLVTALHDSATTQAGKPRRSGYVLETAARTASGQQPETTPCGHCKGSGADPEDEGDYVPEVHRHNPFSVGPCPECNGDGTAVGQPAEVQPADEQPTPQPDPRQPAYDAVYAHIQALGDHMPPDPVHRNAMIWHVVHAALNATPVGRCVSSHCVEGDHILIPHDETGDAR